MKKIYLLLFTFICSLTYGQDLLITGVFDGPLTGGIPKTVELYVINDIPDLSLYGIGSANNGEGTDGEEFTFPADAYMAGDYIYIATEAPQFTAYFGFAPDYTDGFLAVNGDDAIELFENGVVIDVFGDINTDGTGQPWEYLDGWAYRVDGTGPDGSTFELTNWLYSGVDATDGCTTNGSCGSFFPIGTYSTVPNTTPTITVTGGPVTGLDYFVNNGPSAPGSFTVSGVNLSIPISVAAPLNFQVSLSEDSGFADSVDVPITDGTAPPTPVYVRLEAGLAAGPYSGDVLISSSVSNDEMVAVSGTVSPDTPMIVFGGTVDALNYSFGNGPSPSDGFGVSGMFLMSDITVIAPMNFEVSLMEDSGFSSSVTLTPTAGTVENTTVYVRLAAGLPIGPYSGDVTASATDAPNQMISVSGNVFGGATNSLVLTGVFDGPITGGVPKGVEIYVLADIPDLSLYGLASITNGGGSPGQEYTFPADAVSAGTYIYVATEAPEFTNFFGFAPTYTTGIMAINGDDAVELYESGVVIDTFGDINTDGTGEPWEYTDGWAYRVDDTGPDGTTFVLANWTFSGIDQLEGGSTNDTTTSPFPIGTYQNALSVEDFNVTNFSIYPNPSNLGYVNITSANTGTMDVIAYNVLGKRVLTETVSNERLNISSLQAGVYILKITQNNNSITKKLVIK